MITGCFKRVIGFFWQTFLGNALLVKGFLGNSYIGKNLSDNGAMLMGLV